MFIRWERLLFSGFSSKADLPFSLNNALHDAFSALNCFINVYGFQGPWSRF